MAHSENDKISKLNILNAVAYVANIGLVMGVPSLFNLPDNAELSNKYQTIVTPAGWAFAIWGVIFTFQAIWATLQLMLPAFRSNPLVLEGVQYHYILVCAVQVAWTFSFALEQMVMSMVWMTSILYFLFRIFQAQNTVMEEFGHESFNANFWLLRFPFTLHLGWIVAATLVNFNVVLVAHSASSPIQFTFAILSLATALVVGGIALYKQKEQSTPDVTIPLVLCWALNAISNELKSPRDSIVSTFSVEEITLIRSGAAFCAIAVLVGVGVLVGRAIWKKYKGTSSEETRLLDLTGRQVAA